MNDFKATYDSTDPIIRDHVVYAMGAGLIPIPMLDIAAVAAIQLDMIRQLCKKYNADFTESQGKAWVAALTGSSLSRLAAGFVKLIPGVGTILGGVTMSVLSGASTYAVGRVAKENLEKGKAVFDGDLSDAKKKYEEAFEEGKEAAKAWKEEADKKKASPNRDDIYFELEKLGKLRDAGVLTAVEFEEKKKKLLELI